MQMADCLSAICISEVWDYLSSIIFLTSERVSVISL